MREEEKKEVKKGLCVLLLIISLIIAFFFIASDYVDFDITKTQNKDSVEMFSNDTIKN